MTYHDAVLDFRPDHILFSLAGGDEIASDPADLMVFVRQLNVPFTVMHHSMTIGHVYPKTTRDLFGEVFASARHCLFTSRYQLELYREQTGDPILLGQVIARDAYAHMLSITDRLVAQLNAVIAAHRLDWHVSHVGARVELVCSATPPRNGSEARAVMDHELESTIHLYLANRGILLAPFHNMMLVSPVTQAAQVDRLAAELNNALTELLAFENSGGRK